MFSDEFDRFVFADAVGRCGLKQRDAQARVAHYSAWIHHAMVRLGCAQSAAERRAARREIEQDIRNIEARLGWSEQLLSAFRAQADGELVNGPVAVEGAAEAGIVRAGGEPSHPGLVS